MEKITVPFITGDGVGAEVTPSMRTVVDAALKKGLWGQPEHRVERGSGGRTGVS